MNPAELNTSRAQKVISGLIAPALIFLLILLAAGSGCQDRRESAPETTPPDTQASAETRYTGDLDALKPTGRLRILTQRLSETHLPRKGFPLDQERELAANFAQSQGLRAAWVYKDKFEDLIPALLAGQGDLIAANLTVTDSRKKIMAFSDPVGYSQEQIVGRAKAQPLKTAADLKGRTVAVQAGTSFAETLGDLRRQIPEIRKRLLPGRLTSDAILDQVAAGEIDLTIEDSNILDVIQQYRSDVKPLLAVGSRRPLAWGLRPDSPELRKALNRFLQDTRVTAPRENVYKADWPGLVKRHTLRLITLNMAATYFIWRGELAGFEYEMAREFARQNQLRLEVILAPRLDDVLPLLLEGRGDFAAAFLTPTAERKARGIAFSRSYHQSTEMVVGRAGGRLPRQLADLKGRAVAVQRSTSYWSSLQQLQAKGLDIQLKAAPEELALYEILDKVAAKEYDLTVIDSHLLDQELVGRDDVAGAFALGSPQEHGWAVRAEDQRLLAAINAFWSRTYKSTLYNLMYQKYFNVRQIRPFFKEYERTVLAGRISPYDQLARHYADQYDFDWRFIVAQMYQESRFNPRLVSPVGAQGLMQVMPRTAYELGFRNLFDPATGLHAGVKYMDLTRDHFEPEIDDQERHWLTLASYNAGAGHVDDARRLAGRMGWRSDRWFDNVERAMLLLGKEPYARQARHGYVRGREPVTYVHNIYAYYHGYLTVTNRADAKTAAP